MPLSVEQIRKLNQVSLIAIGIDVPEISDSEAFQSDSIEGYYNETDTKKETSESFRISLYSTGPVEVGSRVELGEPINLTKILGGTISAGFQAVSGYAPQLDMERKFLYKGSDPMRFNITGYLLLENDINQDFFWPIQRLAYLTFPRRKTLNEVSEGSAVGRGLKEIIDWVKEQANDLGKLFPVELQKMILGEDKDGNANTVSDRTSKALGDIYFLKVPPTLSMDAEKRGNLTIKYGGFRLPTVVIKSLRVSIPTLFYEGGYPPYLTVDLEVESLRIATFDSYMDTFKKGLK